MRTITAVIAVLALTSCSNGSTTTDDTVVSDSTTIETSTTLPSATTPAAAPTTTTTSTSTTTSTTTSTLAPMEAAQVAYFVISAEYNQKMAEAGDQWSDGNVPWSEYGQWCTPRGAIAEKFATDIADYRWPKDARDEAALLVTTSAAEAQAYYGCSGVSATGAPAASARVSEALAAASDAAASMRIAIGLPLNQG